MSKRISVRIRDPNPLFRLWVSEWANQADVLGRDHLASNFRRALTSLEKYPCKLRTGRECLILDGFGATFCDMLDKKLAKHNHQLANPVVAATTQEDKLIKTPDKPVAPPIRRTKAIPKLPNPATIVPVPAPLPSTSGTNDKSKKTKSPPKIVQKTAPEVNLKVALKRKATATVDTETFQDVIMVPGTFEVILLVDSMETVG